MNARVTMDLAEYRLMKDQIEELHHAINQLEQDLKCVHNTDRETLRKIASNIEKTANEIKTRSAMMSGAL